MGCRGWILVGVFLQLIRVAMRGWLESGRVRWEVLVEPVSLELKQEVD
jgi:hypothetical protein